MGPQFLKTASGDELVVLSRRDYDVLLARLGDEEAEDRLLGDIADGTMRALAAGTTYLLPVWFTDGVMARRHPVRVVREQFGRGLAETAQAAGLAEERLAAIEAGSEAPSSAVLDAVSASVALDPRILRSLYEETEPA